MLLMNNPNHFLHNIRIFGSYIMIFMDICRQIIKERSTFLDNHFPVSHTYTDLVRFIKLPIEKIMFFLVLFTQYGRSKRDTIKIIGNAWFIDKIQYVNNANEEIDAIGQVDLQQTAIVDSKFKEALKGVNEGYKDSLSTIRLTSYEPNQLVYETSSPQDGIVVFSEIYYPGWTATIDGKPADIARADYILRAMNVPAGKHTIEMRFDPQSLHITEGIAYGAMALLLVGVIILIWIYRKKYSENSK